MALASSTPKTSLPAFSSLSANTVRGSASTVAAAGANHAARRSWLPCTARLASGDGAVGMESAQATTPTRHANTEIRCMVCPIMGTSAALRLLCEFWLQDRLAGRQSLVVDRRPSRDDVLRWGC